MIKRYDVDSIDACMSEEIDGDYVLYDDYEILQKRLNLLIGDNVAEEDIDDVVYNYAGVLAEYRIKDRLNAIVHYICPENRPTMGRKKRKNNVRHPMLPNHWWNGAWVSKYVQYGGKYHVSVGSYVGSGEDDIRDVEIPAEWVTSDDWRKLIDESAKEWHHDH